MLPAVREELSSRTSHQRERVADAKAMRWFTVELNREPAGKSHDASGFGEAKYDILA